MRIIIECPEINLQQEGRIHFRRLLSSYQFLLAVRRRTIHVTPTIGITIACGSQEFDLTVWVTWDLESRNLGLGGI